MCVWVGGSVCVCMYGGGGGGLNFCCFNFVKHFVLHYDVGKVLYK